MKPLILSRHIVMPINPLILFPVPEKKNKTKIKRILVDSAQLKKKKKKKSYTFILMFRINGNLIDLGYVYSLFV